MRFLISVFICLMCGVSLFAQDKMYIHFSNKTTLGAPISITDSIYFNSDGSIVYFRINSTVSQFATTAIDSISFGDDSGTIQLIYAEKSVSVFNPLAFEGVSVDVNGANAIVTSTTETKDINYELKGVSTNGMFKIYSNYKFNLFLNGLSLTKTDGPAINIQSKKKCNVYLGEGTINSLADGGAYSNSAEDQKSAFFSEGQLDFEGNGVLNIKSTANHGICSDDYIRILGGTIKVTSAGKDGIHSNSYFKMSSGNLTINANSDGIDCEDGFVEISGGTIVTNNPSANVKGINCDSTLVVSGGNITMTLNGNQSKAIKAKQKILFTGGNINITSTGGAVLEPSLSGYDPSYSCGIKGNSDVEISGTILSIQSSGAGGKGISTDGNIRINSGTITISTSGNGATYKNPSAATDSYSASCLSSEKEIEIYGGQITLSSSGSGGKGIKSSGIITIGNSTASPNLGITTTGAKFLVSGKDYNHPKAIVSDTEVRVNNGNTTISSTDDGIHAEKTFTQNGGTVTINNSYEGVEAYNIILNAGILDILASNDGINATAGTVSGGTESNDGSCLTVNGGTLTTNCTNGDAIDSNGNIVITGGTMVANGPLSGPEEACDFNGTFTMQGGFFIGAGSNSNMTKAMSSGSTQANMYIVSASAISSSSMLHIQDAAGKDILSFKPKYGGYKFLFSSGSLSKGASYSVYTGGTYTGGTSLNGLYSGGTYSVNGASLKKTQSLSTSASVNTISF